MKNTPLCRNCRGKTQQTRKQKQSKQTNKSGTFTINLEICKPCYNHHVVIATQMLFSQPLTFWWIRSQPSLAIYFMTYAHYSLSYSVHFILYKKMEKSTSYSNKMCDIPTGIIIFFCLITCPHDTILGSTVTCRSSS